MFNKTPYHHFAIRWTFLLGAICTVPEAYAIDAAYSGQHRSTEYKSMKFIINFADDPASSGTQFLRHMSFTAPKSGQSVRYLDIKHDKSTSVGHCWHYNFTDFHPGVDWILWANTGTASAPNWVLFADDVNDPYYGAAPMQPHARIWIKGPVYQDLITRFRLSPYFASGNGSAAAMIITDLGKISEASCLNTPVPVAKVTSNTITLINPH